MAGGPLSLKGDEPLPEDTFEVQVGRSCRRCGSLQQWLQGLGDPRPPLHRSDTLPLGYGFRFLRGRIRLVAEASGCVVDLRRPVPGSQVSFRYGPWAILQHPELGESSELEPHQWAIQDAQEACVPCFGEDDFVLARALDPTASPAPRRSRCSRRPCSVPPAAPARPRPVGLQACLEAVNPVALSRVLRTQGLDGLARSAGEGASLGTPLSFALDLLQRPWDGAGLVALSSMVLLLIEHRADLNTAVPPHGETPLQILLRPKVEEELAQVYQARLAVAMLRAKADPNKKDRRGESPLSEAATAGDVQMCKLLLDHGAYTSALSDVTSVSSDMSLDHRVRNLLNQAASRQSRMLQEHLAAGRAHLRSGATAHAARCFAQALSVDPCNVEALLAAAEGEYSAGAFERAYDLASRAVALAPLNGQGYELCARSLLQLDRAAEAKGLCVACAALPEAPNLGRLLRHLAAMETLEKEPPDAEQLRQAEELWADLAEEEKASAWGGRVRLSLARLCVLLGCGSRALEETRCLRSSQPANGWVLYWHARALLCCGFRQDALGALGAAAASPGAEACQTLAARLREAELRRREGEEAAAKEDWAGALRGFAAAEAAAEADPVFGATVLVEKALAKLRLGRAGEALADLADLADLAESARGFWVRGLVLLELKRFEQALQDLSRAADLDPSYRDAPELGRAERWARRAPVPDHYGALEVPPTASSAQIKKAYRLAALRWHPDKNAGNEAVAEQAFKQIQAAFETLSDQQRRRDYDAYEGDRLPFAFGKTAT